MNGLDSQLLAHTRCIRLQFSFSKQVHKDDKGKDLELE